MRFDYQDQLADYAHERLQEQIRRAEELVRPLDSDQRMRLRDDGGWSVDQILAHLARMNESYLSEMETLADTPVKDTLARRTWKPTIGGRFLLWSVTTSFRMKTPGTFRPEALEDPLQAFVSSQRRIVALLEKMRAMDWSTLRCASPASSLLRLNAGDVFLVLAVHGDRHLKQLERQQRAVTGTSPTA